MSELTVIDIRGTGMKSLPSSMDKLMKLKTFYVNSCDDKALKTMIKKMQKANEGLECKN